MDLEFELRASKRKLFDRCGLGKGMYRIDGKKVFLLLRWDLLVMFGTNAQLVAWDKYRVKYVADLLKKHCTPLLECKTHVIGSQSPKSDIDINVTCPKHIEDVLVAIKADHDAKFKRSMEEMFDFNVYASVFRYLRDKCEIDRVAACYPKYELGMRQRMWSFLRIVEFTSALPPASRKSLTSRWPVEHRRLYTETKVLYDNLRRRRLLPSYGRAIRKFFDELDKKPQDPHKVAEAFSFSKFLERETYRSVGAVLHIVERHGSMPKSAYYDSIYDNLGFVFEIMLAPALCVEDLFYAKVVKTAKYIERILDALKRVQALDTKLLQIESIAQKINQDRKALVKMEHIPYPELLKALDAGNNSLDYITALSWLLFSQLQDKTLKISSS